MILVDNRLLAKIKSVMDRLLPTGFKLDVATLTAATVASQALLVIASPVLTRIYTSTDFGYLQIYLSITVFFSVAISLRYETAIALPGSDDVGADLVGLSLIVAVLMTIVSCGVVALIRTGIVFGGQAGQLGAYIWLIPASAFATGAYQTLTAWAVRKRLFRDLAATRLTQSVGNVGAQLALGFFHVGFLGLLIGDVLGRTSGTVRLARSSWRQCPAPFKQVRVASMWRAAVRYRRFPHFAAGSVLINTAGFALPFLLIAQFYGPMTLGLFALADRLIEAPANLIGISISQVYTAKAARLVNSDPGALKMLFKKLAKKLFLISVGPTLAIACLGPTLFQWAFGVPWREAGFYSVLLVPLALLGMTASPLMPTLTLLERQDTQLKWDIGRAIFTVTGLYCAHYWHLSARLAVFTYSATMATAYGIHLLLSYRSINQHARVHSGGFASELPSEIEPIGSRIA